MSKLHVDNPRNKGDAGLTNSMFYLLQLTSFDGLVAQARRKSEVPSPLRPIKGEKDWNPDKAWTYFCPRRNSHLHAQLEALTDSHWSRQKVDGIYNTNIPVNMFIGLER